MLASAASLVWIAIVVESVGSCPTPGAVAARLAALTAGSDVPGRAVLLEEPNGLRIRLLRPDGTVVGDRRLLGTHPCTDLAEAAALVVASWQSELRPAPVPAPSPRRMEGDATAAVGENTPAVASSGRSASDESASAWELGAGGLLLLPPGGVAPGVVIEGGWGARASGFGWDATFGIAIGRTEAVGPQRARWGRFPLTVQGRWRGQILGSLVFELYAGLAAALLTATGEGFLRNDTARAFEFGAVGGSRFTYLWGQWTAWVGVAALAWARPQELRGLPDDAGPRLPQLGPQIGAGIRRQFGGL